ncbi:MAG: TonB-dependent receptor [Gammaproteobacteria bacterium]|jgi:iron complex outermembrane receptor protein|nr:TonB-dependent receptor [Gammaproteobacteria bacterium]
MGIFSRSLTVGTSAAVLAFAMPAFAQDTTDTGEDRDGAVQRVLGPVTVTATKKADVEDVQNVPIAVTAFNADTLDALNVNNLEDLSFTTPNVSLDDIGTSRGTANFAIRGLGVNSSIPSIDPAVGVFIDGVYLGVNNGVIIDLFDLESVEVLRGPQGLLFGRNTTGGALVVNTGNPTEEFSWKARAALDGPIDDDRGGAQTMLQGIVSGPVVEDKLLGKFGVSYTNDEGYFNNLAKDENHGELNSLLFRGALEWRASEDITFLGKMDYLDSRSDGPSGQNRGIYERDTFDMAIDNDGNVYSDMLFGSLRTDIDVDFGNGTITNILGYRSYEATAEGDIDAAPAFLFHSETEFDQEQWSNELRYAGSFGKAQLTTGIYYFNQDLAYTEQREIPPSSPLEFFGGGRQDHTVFGLFGQVDYAITDKLTGIFGLRYSNEEKDADITYIRPRPECSVVDETCPTTGTNPFIPGEANGFSESDEWSNVTPKVGLQYFLDDTTQFYGSYTKGFRSGGYNFRITDANAFLAVFGEDGPFAFDEEEVDAYEIGVKTGAADGTWQLNAAVYQTEISDMQREVNAASEDAAVVQTILNTADATLTGFELEGRVALTDTFLLTGNIGLIDAEYDSVQFDISGDRTVNGDDLALALPRVPEATYGIGAIWDISLGDNGGLVATANYQHRDEFAYTDSNFGWVQEADMVNADLTWNTPVDGVSVSLYGKNLLDEVQVGNDTQLPFPGPRSNGVQEPFQAQPGAGTFSPLKKGRLVGLEFVIRR